MKPLVLDAHGRPIVVRTDDGRVYGLSDGQEPPVEPDPSAGWTWGWSTADTPGPILLPETAPLVTLWEPEPLLVASETLAASEKRREEAMRRLGAFNDEIAQERAERQARDVRYLIDGLRSRPVL